MERFFDYRGDCWKAYQDIGLCLRILPPGESFEFIVERDKIEKVKNVISHNNGEVIFEEVDEDDVRMKVEKKLDVKES